MDNTCASTNLDIGTSDLDSPRLLLNENVIRNLKFSKVFRENSGRINSLSFNDAGDLLITASDDESIIIYDCMQGTSKRALNSKKYGVDLIKYTHASSTAIHASTKVDDTIRYLSLHDNKYIRYFSGHQDRVTCLVMSPLEDIFLSCSLDKTLRLWDLRSPNCQGLMHLPGRAIANFDPDGLIFAVGLSSDKLNLYDLRSFDKGPFSSFKVPGTHSTSQNDSLNSSFSSAGSTISSVNCNSGGDAMVVSNSNGGAAGVSSINSEWISLRFSPDERLIALLTADEQIRLLDAFNGSLMCQLSTHDCADSTNSESSSNKAALTAANQQQQFTDTQLRTQIPQNVTFSPDSQFLFCGSSEGVVNGWDIKSGRKIAVLTSENVGPVCHVEFNPKYMLLSSACTNLILWLPDPDANPS